MPKSSQKTVGASQPANERGKSRFGSPGRTARVVLPERPPRAVDNEIVSILLGADPASLTTPAGDISSENSAIPEALKTDTPPVSSLVQVPAAPASESAAPRVSEIAAPSPEDLLTPVPTAESSPDVHVSAVSTEFTRSEDGITAAAESVARSPSRRRDSAAVNVRHARPERAIAPAAEIPTQAAPISSFEEFTERWKHGLRKGQLKICEVLYQKTYAVGQTECVTSFSELGRLSGLKMRQCFNVIAQLEALKFVERARSTDTSNKKDQGSVIRFHLFPAQ